MLAMTSLLITNLKKDKNSTKGRIMQAAMTMENFGLEYARYHLNKSRNATIVEKSQGYSK